METQKKFPPGLLLGGAYILYRCFANRKNLGGIG